VIFVKLNRWPHCKRIHYIELAGLISLNHANPKILDFWRPGVLLFQLIMVNSPYI
jgi:hypothetical protein